MVRSSFVNNTRLKLTNRRTTDGFSSFKVSAIWNHINNIIHREHYHKIGKRRRMVDQNIPTNTLLTNSPETFRSTTIIIYLVYKFDVINLILSSDVITRHQFSHPGSVDFIETRVKHSGTCSRHLDTPETIRYQYSERPVEKRLLHSEPLVKLKSTSYQEQP